MPDIENYQVYNDRMRRSMWDKAFYMDKIAGADTIIDYGCADGSLVRFLSELFPAMRFIGFDIDPVMIAQANAQRGENTWFFSTMEEVLEQLARMNVTGGSCAVSPISNSRHCSPLKTYSSKSSSRLLVPKSCDSPIMEASSTMKSVFLCLFCALAILKLPSGYAIT